MSDKITCPVVQDLMPLVIDGASSEDTKKIVDEHIAHCASCQEAYQMMQAKTAEKMPDEKANAGFRQAMKKGARRFRVWKMVAGALSAVLLAAVIAFFVNPTLFYGFGNRVPVPVKWMQNARLERTEQGAVLLRFKPDARYRHFFGISSLSGRQNKEPGFFDYCLTFSYPWIAKVLNRDFQDEVFKGEYQYYDRYVLRPKNGDWAIALPTGSAAEWYYQGGKIVSLIPKALTEEDIRAKLKEGAQVDGNKQIIKINEAPNMPLRFLLQGDGEKLVYQSGDDVPLCDSETQQSFDRLLKECPYLFRAPGTLIDEVEG